MILVDLDSDEEHQQYARLSSELGRGESASIAIAARRGWLLRTDDRHTRVQAQREGIHPTGALSLIQRLIRFGALSLDGAHELLAAMIARARHRSPITDFRSLLGGSTEERFGRLRCLMHHVYHEFPTGQIRPIRRMDDHTLHDPHRIDDDRPPGAIDRLAGIITRSQSLFEDLS